MGLSRASLVAEGLLPSTNENKNISKKPPAFDKSSIFYARYTFDFFFFFFFPAIIYNGLFNLNHFIISFQNVFKFLYG